MKLKHREKLVTGLLDSYAMSVRQCYPGETNRQLIRRLVDVLHKANQGMFLARDDSRHFIARLKHGEGTLTVLTVFDNNCVDLSLPVEFTDEMQEDMFMMLFGVLTLAVSVTVSQGISDMNTRAATAVQRVGGNFWNTQRQGTFGSPAQQSSPL